jgi:hypothetical protein
MLNRQDARLALRARLRSLEVCTTGTMALAATANGYTRAAGSFLTDGFRVGMELLAAGFATSGNNGYKVITEVTALTMAVTSPTTMATEAAGGNESLTVGLPETCLWENERPVRSGVAIEQPTQGRPYIAEELVPATYRLRTMPSNGGRADNTGMYVVHWFGLSGQGSAGIEDCIQAVKARFASGTTVTVGSDVVRTSGETGPLGDTLRPLSNGWTLCTIRIPWYADTQNAVAA